MSDEEPKVSVEGESTPRFQWATGIFWRKEANKRTIISRNLTAFCGLFMVIVSVVLLLVKNPDDFQVSTRKNDISAPNELNTTEQVNVPQVADKTESAQRKTTGAKGKSESTPRYSGPQVVSRPRGVKIPPGTMIRAALISGASDGPVRAEVKESFVLQGETLIEQGTVLLGQGQSGDDRLTIHFTQMVYRDGAFEAINAQACDVDDRIPGIKGSKVGREILKLGAGIGLNFVGGMTQGLQDSTYLGGMEVRRPSAKNAMLNGASTATLEQAREVMSDYQNKRQAIQVPALTEVWMLFEGGK